MGSGDVLTKIKKSQKGQPNPKKGGYLFLRWDRIRSYFMHLFLTIDTIPEGETFAYKANCMSKGR